MNENIKEEISRLNQLVVQYYNEGRFEEAIQYASQSCDITKQYLGENHPDFAASLNNMAALYNSMGNYSEAEPLYKEAMEIWRKALGDDHPDFATSLNNMAELYKSMGNYSEAEPLYKKAMEIRRKVLGKDHPDFATSLNNLAMLYIATDRATNALPLMEQASSIDNLMIGQVFSIGSESQRTAYLQEVRSNFDAFISLVSQRLSSSPAAINSALELVLRRKAIGAEALAAQRDAVLGGRYPELESRFNQLKTLRMQIAQKTLAGPGPEGLAEHQKTLSVWNTEKENLEAKLARQIPEMNLEQKLKQVDRNAVSSALPKGAGLIEFVCFDVYDFKAVPAKGEKRWKPARYLAFVMPSDEPDNVQMIDLGEAVFIDKRIERYRASVTGESERDERGLGIHPEAPGRVKIPHHGIELREAIFDKLKPALGNCNTLVFSPDGEMSRIPFEVLPSENGRFLIDDYNISYVAAGRDILRFEAESFTQPGIPLVIADPDFDLGRTEETSVSQGNISRSRQSRDMDRSNLHFGRLPGTRDEGESISRMLEAESWVEEKALEAKLKTYRSPHILHFATHGFFLNDQERDLNKEMRDLGTMGFSGSSKMERLQGSGHENPLLRSGLALAGVNTWLKGQNPPTDAEDGLLTAEDVTGLDLLDTELVVLSACETGLGEVRTGVGVFGLRPSFVLAGAKTLVMSLWKVPDQQTRELMEDFYSKILSGEARADALRNAQMTIRAKYPDPFYWGAFICQGDPAPMALRKRVS